MAIFVTSDSFFSRKDIIKINKRNFSNVEEMNETLITNWNKTVNDRDTVYHLGNFAWDPFSVNITLERLNGKIKFLLGDRDKALEEFVDMHENAEILKSSIVELPKYKMVLCHYPLEYWKGKEVGTIHLHGHSYIDFPTDLNKHLRLNVSADIWSFKPVKVNVILEFVKLFLEKDLKDDKEKISNPKVL